MNIFCNYSQCALPTEPTDRIVNYSKNHVTRQEKNFFIREIERQSQIENARKANSDIGERAFSMRVRRHIRVRICRRKFLGKPHARLHGCLIFPELRRTP